jgi:uncharacterized membrane protein
LLAALNTSAFAQESSPEDKPVVRAVLFYSPSCPHCIFVRDEIFPPLYEAYGGQLDILEIDISTEAGDVLFNQMIEAYAIPPGHRGVPFLIVGNVYIVGSGDIPEFFPNIIATALEEGGTDWPVLPGLEEFIQAHNAEEIVETQSPENVPEKTEEDRSGESSTPEVIETPTPEGIPTSTPVQQASQTDTITVDEIAVNPLQASDPDTPLFIVRFQQDLVGNSVAVVVLIGMVAAVIYTGVVFMRAEELREWPWWVTPLLIIVGIGVAAYLSFVEVSGSEAICGPVGDCNAVQTSPYARLFGVIHVGVLGIVGYILIGAVWAVGRWGKEAWQSLANMAMFLLSVFGVLFSIYLTFLEPFVIGATCMWCISSSVVMTLLLLNATPIALGSWMVYDEDIDDEPNGEDEEEEAQ